MGDIRLTVIVPGYNNKIEWWRRCVRSVAKATGPDDEILLVDDGSTNLTEGSLEAIALEERTKAKILVLHKSNGGLADARNFALKIATGRYVTFVDSDDEVCEDVYERSIAEIVKHNVDIAIFGVRVIWPDDGLEKTDAFESSRILGKLSPDDVLRLYESCLLNYACNKVYRLDFLKRNELLFNIKAMPCEDIVFNLSCIMAEATFFAIEYIGYVYYRTHGTLLSRFKTTGFVGTRLACEAWRQYKDATPKAKVILGDLGEMSKQQEQYEEWRNIWMPGSPYSLIQRWTWLRDHTGMGGVMVYVKMMAWSFLRGHFYFRPIRRWHIKRMFPNAKDWVSK